MTLVCCRLIRHIVTQRTFLNTRDLNAIITRVSSNFSSILKNTPQSTSVTLSVNSKFNALNDTKLKELRHSIESVINENKYFEKVFNKIIHSNKISRHVDFVKYPQTINRNRNTRENLKKKLRFKLGCIIICLRKITNSCSKSFLNETSQLKLLTDTILNHMKENSDYKSSEIDNLDSNGIIGIDYEELNEFNFLDSTEDELDLEENEIESEDFYNDEPFVNISVDIKEFKRFYVFNYVLEEYGNILDEKYLAEYSEDVVKSLEIELEGHIDSLRGDFAHIDKFIKELKVAIVKEWLNKYEENIFQNKYGQKILNLNYLEENDEK